MRFWFLMKRIIWYFNNIIECISQCHRLPFKENSCGEATSFDITPMDVAGSLVEVDICREMMDRPGFTIGSHDSVDFDLLKSNIIRRKPIYTHSHSGEISKNID
jgi:hypothetical protein